MTRECSEWSATLGTELRKSCDMFDALTCERREATCATPAGRGRELCAFSQHIDALLQARRRVQAPAAPRVWGG